MGEIGHIETALAATITPLAISPSTWMNKIRPDHNPESSMPDSLRIVCGFFCVPVVVWTLKGGETGPKVYSPYLRRLERLAICGCNYKGSTFSSVILRPWVWVQPESNSRSPAWLPEPIEPPAHAHNQSSSTNNEAKQKYPKDHASENRHSLLWIKIFNLHHTSKKERQVFLRQIDILVCDSKNK